FLVDDRKGDSTPNRTVQSIPSPGGKLQSQECYPGETASVCLRRLRTHQHAGKSCYAVARVGKAAGGMHWVRSNRRLGSGLALVALALQIALSLVHAHFGNA